MVQPIVRPKRALSLVVLCVLTLLGNAFLLFKALMTYLMLDIAGEGRIPEADTSIDVFFAVEVLSCIGSMLGAVLMLDRRLLGLQIYLVSTSVYMLMTGALAILSILSIAGIPLALLQFVYLVPTALFMALFVTHKKHLT